MLIDLLKFTTVADMAAPASEERLLSPGASSFGTCIEALTALGDGKVVLPGGKKLPPRPARQPESALSLPSELLWRPAMEPQQDAAETGTRGGSTAPAEFLDTQTTKGPDSQSAMEAAPAEPDRLQQPGGALPPPVSAVPLPPLEGQPMAGQGPLPQAGGEPSSASILPQMPGSAPVAMPRQKVEEATRMSPTNAEEAPPPRPRVAAVLPSSEEAVETVALRTSEFRQTPAPAPDQSVHPDPQMTRMPATGKKREDFPPIESPESSLKVAYRPAVTGSQGGAMPPDVQAVSGNVPRETIESTTTAQSEALPPPASMKEALPPTASVHPHQEAAPYPASNGPISQSGPASLVVTAAGSRPSAFSGPGAEDSAPILSQAGLVQERVRAQQQSLDRAAQKVSVALEKAPEASASSHAAPREIQRAQPVLDTAMPMPPATMIEPERNAPEPTDVDSSDPVASGRIVDSVPHGERVQPRSVTVPPASATLSEPVGHLAWERQLARHLVGISREQGGEAVLRLHPASLGRLEVQVTTTAQGETHIRLQAAHPQVRKALESALPRLREAFQASGLELVSAEVSRHVTPNSTTPQGAAHPAGGWAGNAATSGFGTPGHHGGDPGGQRSGQPLLRDPEPELSTPETSTPLTVGADTPERDGLDYYL